MPEEFDPSKPRMLIANVNTRCVCGVKLTSINSNHKLFNCELCKRKKECPKQCQSCSKYFCLRCKSIDIESDGTCAELDHEFVKLRMADYPANVQTCHEYGCMRCLTPCEEYYFDVKCKIRACETCFNYLMKVSSDKNRPIITKCDISHVLTYVAGEIDHVDVCSECKKQKIIKLRCYYCE